MKRRMFPGHVILSVLMLWTMEELWSLTQLQAALRPSGVAAGSDHIVLRTINQTGLRGRDEAEQLLLLK